MKSLRMLYHLMRADFLERVRRHGFLIVVAVAIYIGIMFVPPIGANYQTVAWGNSRGVYNSAWVGAMFGLMAATLLPLPGFYLVKSALDRDRQTRVGQIIATTPISKVGYLVGKVLSNTAVLGLITAILMAVAPVMQIVRAEALPVNVWQVVAPLLLMFLPVAALTASVAVLFESIPLLRGGVGNIVYFFLWILFLIGSIPGEEDPVAGFMSDLDPLGFVPVVESIESAFEDQIGSAEEVGLSIGYSAIEGETSTFLWEGVEWTSAYALQRGLYFILAFALVFPAAVFFDRFDPACSEEKKQSGGYFTQIWNPLKQELALTQAPFVTPMANGVTHVAGRLTPVSGGRARFRLLDILIVEMKLLLKGQKWWWFAVAAGVNIAGLCSPVEDGLTGLLPAAWIWPILIWSQMGTREHRHNTGQIVFSAPRPVLRQLPVVWLAGVLLTAITGIGVAIRLALAGAEMNLLGWGVGVLFIPALALALGVWSGHSRTFEIVYLILWYTGLANQVPILDYAGVTTEGLAMGMPFVYLGITCVLMVLAVIGRQWRLQG